MPKCKACCTPETVFETYEELDRHFEEVHPKPPPTPCPPGYEDVAEFMVDSMIPERLKNPSSKERKSAEQILSIMREWNAETVHSLLTKLLAQGYDIIKSTERTICDEQQSACGFQRSSLGGLSGPQRSGQHQSP